MLKGYFGKFLWIDLEKKEISEEKVDESLYRDYLGGYGLGAKVIFDRQRPSLKPFDPENILGFVTGPLVGTPAITGCRFVVVGKSPLTETWGDSNCGGYFGPAMKKTGFDAIFFTGNSEEPVYLWVKDGKAELLSAEELWGKDSSTTEDILKEKHGKKVQIASIGEPGERKNLIACIMHDKGRAAGRSGLGALMGAKKLKALVVEGNLDVPLADADQTKEVRQKCLNAYKDNPAVKHFNKYGTIDHVASSALQNDAPVKNWVGVGETEFPTASQISDDAILEYETKKYACWRCPIACGGYYEVKDGPYKVKDAHKPEYETSSMFGSNLLNDNLPSIILANELCNKHGFDSIGAGAAVGFAMECYEKGFLTKEDTGGLELNWGNHEAMIELLKMMIKGEGIGAVLADGAWAASRKIGRGTEEFVVHARGQDLPAHDPRFAPSWGLHYKVDATPGRHTQLGLVPYELGGGYPGLKLDTEVDRWGTEGKGSVSAKVHNIKHAVYGTGVCMFAIQRTDINAWVEFTNAICGTDYTLADFETIGARIAALRQAFNVREGLAVADFELAWRSWGTPFPEGFLKGITLDLAKRAADYYEAQGWTVRGVPKKERLIELGLDNVVKALYS